MYKLRISPRSCLTDAEVQALRGKLANMADYQDLIDEDAIVFDSTGKVLARSVTNCLPQKVVTEAAEQFRTVRGELSNRGNVIYKDAMMNRRRADGSFSFTKAVPPSTLKLLQTQNARKGLTGPYCDVLGYLDKTPRQPFCRPTAWSLGSPDILEISRTLVEEVEYVNKQELPYHWRRQRDFMKQVSQRFKYKNSIFSTLTVNLNLRCAYHTDDGDYRGGVGNLVTLELPDVESGILVMPRERVAFVVRPTDCLLMNVHHLHGNLPLTPHGTRLTAVLYARERIAECGK